MAAMAWTFDIMLEKKKESKKRVIFSPFVALINCYVTQMKIFMKLQQKKFVAISCKSRSCPQSIMLSTLRHWASGCCEHAAFITQMSWYFSCS